MTNFEQCTNEELKHIRDTLLLEMQNRHIINSSLEHGTDDVYMQEYGDDINIYAIKTSENDIISAIKYSIHNSFLSERESIEFTTEQFENINPMKLDISRQNLDLWFVELGKKIHDIDDTANKEKRSLIKYFVKQLNKNLIDIHK